MTTHRFVKEVFLGHLHQVLFAKLVSDLSLICHVAHQPLNFEKLVEFLQQLCQGVAWSVLNLTAGSSPFAMIVL
jgi:hypothetical protein